MQTSPRVLKNIPTPSLNKPIVYDDGMTEDLIDEIREDNNFKIEKRLKMERASARLVALKRARLNKKEIPESLQISTIVDQQTPLF